MADIRVENHGSVILLRPVSEAATDWFDEHFPEDRMTWGGAVVVEPRYVDAIIEGAQGDGLEVECDATVNYASE